MNKNYFQKYKNSIMELLDTMTASIYGNTTSIELALEELCKVAKWCKKKNFPIFFLGDIDGSDNIARIPFEELLTLGYKCIFVNEQYIRRDSDAIGTFGKEGGLLVIINTNEEHKGLFSIAQKAKRHGIYIVNMTSALKSNKIPEISDIDFIIPYDKKGPIMVMQLFLLLCWIDALAKK